MKLEKKDLEHIAELARLELTTEEYEKYGNQLSDILSYFEQLKEIDTDTVEPTAQITGLENVMREDVVKDWDKNEIFNAINQAPEVEDNQIKVKKVL